MQLKKFIKNFVLLCGIYILIQGFHYTTVLAANNMDEPSVKSDITNSTNLHNTSPAKSTDDIQTGSPTENEENKNAEITNDLNAASKKIPDSAQISSADAAPAKLLIPRRFPPTLHQRKTLVPHRLHPQPVLKQRSLPLRHKHNKHRLYLRTLYHLHQKITQHTIQPVITKHIIKAAVKPKTQVLL